MHALTLMQSVSRKGAGDEEETPKIYDEVVIRLRILAESGEEKMYVHCSSYHTRLTR